VPAATIFIYFFTPPFGQQFLLAHLLAKKKKIGGMVTKAEQKIYIIKRKGKFATLMDDE